MNSKEYDKLISDIKSDCGGCIDGSEAFDMAESLIDEDDDLLEFIKTNFTKDRTVSTSIGVLAASLAY